MPIFSFFIPTSVKPKLANLAIIGKQFRQLISHELNVFSKVFIFVRRFVSIPKRIINAKLQPILFACFGDFIHYIRLHPRRGNIIIRILAIPKAKAIVVLRNQQNITKAGITGNSYPLIAIQVSRIIGSGRNSAIRPFIIRKCIYTEMDKHAITSFH